MADLVHSTRIDDIVVLELNRPEKRNALSVELIAALNDAIGDLEQDDTMNAEQKMKETNRKTYKEDKEE